jgi:hypothetical protein
MARRNIVDIDMLISLRIAIRNAGRHMRGWQHVLSELAET